MQRLAPLLRLNLSCIDLSQVSSLKVDLRNAVQEMGAQAAVDVVDKFLGIAREVMGSVRMVEHSAATTGEVGAVH